MFRILQQIISDIIDVRNNLLQYSEHIIIIIYLFSKMQKYS